MGFFFHHHEDNNGVYDQVYDSEGNIRRDGDNPSFGQEVIAAAAAAYATKKYEDHVGRNGNPPSHRHAKEWVAAAAGFEADRLAQEHHLNEEERRQFREQAQNSAADSVTPDNFNQFSDQSNDNWQEYQPNY